MQSQPSRYALSIAVIVAANIYTFAGHYLGIDIPPWDFVGGYHHQPVGWYGDGSIFSPPVWFPYGSMGFPAWWALQSGAWYVPLQVLDWLGADYTLTIASALHVGHVALGAIGMLVLLRALGAGFVAATLGGLTYHFSSIFFPSLEFVDFTRGAALLPWVLHAFHPTIIQRRPIMVGWASLLLFQFLIAAYPGMTVAGAYTGALAFAWWLAACPRERRLPYTFAVFMAATAGAMMSLVKFLTPVLLALGKFERPGLATILPEHLYTFLFHYDLPALGSDLVLRSLWSPPLVLLFFPFLKRPSSLMWLGASFATLALLIPLDPVAPLMRQYLPGLSISRMMHGEWRPTLHIGVAIMSVALFECAVRTEICRLEIFARTAAVGTFVIVIGLAATTVGYTIGDIAPEVATFLLFLVAAATACTWGADRKPNTRFLLISSTAFIFLAVASYTQHFIRVPYTWGEAWDDEVEIRTYGTTVAELMAAPRQSSWDRRPARNTYGLPVSTEVEWHNPRFARGWYAQEFSAFSYDNLATPEFHQFVSVYNDAVLGPRLLEFMLHPSQVVFSAGSTEADLSLAASCPASDTSCALNAIASAEMVSFGLSGSEFEIEANESVQMLENEMWYEGWQGRLCNGSGECELVTPSPSDASLRTWNIPQGEWTLTTTFVQPYLSIAKGLWLLGLAVALLPAAVNLVRLGVGSDLPLQISSSVNGGVKSGQAAE